MEFEVHWGQHPLRPELVESTYFLYEVWNQTVLIYAVFWPNKVKNLWNLKFESNNLLVLLYLNAEL